MLRIVEAGAWAESRRGDRRNTNTFAEEGAAHLVPFVGDAFEIFATVVTHDSLESYRAAQHFRSVSTDTDVGDVVSFARCSNKNFAGASDFDTLPNQRLLVAFCDAMSHHPTGGTARGRSGSRILATIKNHASSDLEPIFM